MNRLPESEKLYEVLSDGNWHSVEELIDVAGPVINPARAWRRAAYRAMILRKSRSDKVTSLMDYRPAADAVETGRRSIIVDRLWVMKKGGYVESRVLNQRLNGEYRLVDRAK